ncbi:MAG: UDP-N-acetylglucosamine--N-acetylmuramyl-(pentapeptide) pyrophosphoryl-undecaprenol N-acetylglucosamine transferase [Patescibacteria group bacterium]|nr:MAG: UDP-N-acetylglucosamine--N-acetylmuramyl-(pentapeptide) pyrophosphoryl-undecaprenol N-acetylglucosamine transferase [Patescibacteria group bacterium]
MRKYLITGGHPAPAFAIIDYLKQKDPNSTIILVGRKYNLEGDKGYSLDYKNAVEKKIKFYDLRTGKFIRSLSFDWIKNVFRIIQGFWESYRIIKSEKPDVIISFGGYIALPIALIGFLNRVPIFTHEQTRQAGLSNICIAFFAKKVFVSFYENQKQFPFFLRKKIIVTGNPVRSAVFKIINKPFKINKNKPVIYVTGGSLGAHSLNKHIFNIIDRLCQNYIVIHQTGSVQKYSDYETGLKIQKILNKSDNCYFIKEHFTDNEIGYIYSIADIVVSRSGANTFFEIVRLKKPAVLVPLLWSAGREQILQAEILKSANCAEIFNQNKTSEKLLELINKVAKNYESYKKNFDKLSDIYIQHAEEIIYKEISKSIFAHH